jgi:hypothetical protein
VVRILTGKRALRRRLKDVQRELSAVQSDIRSIEKGKPLPHRSAAPARSPLTPPAAALAGPLPGMHGDADGPEDHVESLLEAERKQPRPPLDEGRLAREDRVIKERAEKVRDDRFSDYLASSFEAGGPLRYERRIQRNKAVILAIVVVVVLLWLLSRFV